MMRFFLDDVAIAEPEGSAGLYFEKVRDARLNGILRRNIGRIAGIGEIVVTEPEAVRLLESAWQSQKMNANVAFRIESGGIVIFRGAVNFSNFRILQRGWSITLQDEVGMEQFLSELETIQPIPCTTKKVVEPFDLLESKTHEIAEDVVYSYNKQGATQSMSWAAPYKAITSKSVVTGKSNTVANAKTISPVYSNDTGVTLRATIEGKLTVTHQMAGGPINGTIFISVRRNGETLANYYQATLVIGDAPTTTTVALRKEIDVIAGSEVYVWLDCANSVNNFSFIFGKGSYLFVGEKPRVSSSSTFSTTIDDALNYIAQRNSLSFDSDDLLPYHITDAYNLRGGSRPLKTSFWQLYQDAIKLVGGLTTTLEDNNVLRISSTRKMIENYGSGFWIENVVDYEITPAVSLFCSGVLAGYNRWQSDTPTGNEEQYAVCRWSSQALATNLLNAELQHLAASKRLIEKLRRIRFQQVSLLEDQKDDNQLLLLDAIEPLTIAKSWQWLWSLSGDMAESYQEAAATSTPLNATKPLFTGEFISVECVIDATDWPNVQDVATVTLQGGTYTIWVQRASYRPGAAGSGANSNTIIEGLLINI